MVGCSALKGSGDAPLDRAACAPMRGRGASFRPALDGSGKPVSTNLILPIAWTAPVGTPRAEADAPFGLVITGR